VQKTNLKNYSIFNNQVLEKYQQKQKKNPNHMKTINRSIRLSFSLGLLLFIVSCSSTVDKKTELENLKKQHDKIADQIKKLEAQLKVTDSVTAKFTNVIATEVKTSTFNHYIEVQGKVDGEENTTVFPANMGTVTAVYVKEGDVVKKGQVLAQLDNSVLAKNIETAMVNVDLANTFYTKYKALWDQKIGSEVQFLQAKTNKEAAEKNLSALTEQLDLYKVKSPINGAIEEVNAKIGQYASPQNPLPLFRVVNFNSVKILADIAEAYASKVKVGNNVKVFFPDFNTEFDAKLHFSSRYINPTNRTFQVEMRLGPSSKVDYRANMMAVVKINDYSNPKAIVLPINVVKESQTGKFIWTTEQSAGNLIARKKFISVGQTYNGMVEVTSGLTEGDIIITTGFNSLVDGQFVKTN
jgi:membrane fusion protein, multidrug efflux system